MKKDNIGIAPMDIPVDVDLNLGIKTINNIPYGHKISLTNIKKGEFIFKYGQKIGISLNNIEKGEHVHTHNLAFTEFERRYSGQVNKINKDEQKRLIF